MSTPSTVNVATTDTETAHRLSVERVIDWMRERLAEPQDEGAGALEGRVLFGEHEAHGEHSVGLEPHVHGAQALDAAQEEPAWEQGWGLSAEIALSAIANLCHASRAWSLPQARRRATASGRRRERGRVASASARRISVVRGRRSLKAW